MYKAIDKNFVGHESNIYKGFDLISVYLIDTIFIGYKSEIRKCCHIICVNPIKFN